MSTIRFGPLEKRISGSIYEAALRDFADRVSTILAKGTVGPFFPGYTDHGLDHVQRVLMEAISLIPRAAMQRLTQEDAVVLIGGTLLHDIAMHLQPASFLALIAEESKFKPLPWFDSRQREHNPDRKWQELWLDYVAEARRFSQESLARIVGSESAESWSFNGLAGTPAEWCGNDHLIIGEFIRRHHPRIAHEIGHYGFPGIPNGVGVGQFPAIASDDGPLKKLGDLVGLVARSHGMSLRVCTDYLQSQPRYRKTPRPLGSAVVYPMALLRVADYLQLNSSRAPAVLLGLTQPQSTVSLEEWQKHAIVEDIGDAEDKHGIRVTVSNCVPHHIFTAFTELLNGLQRELDHSAAVLDEVYNQKETEVFRLTKRRVHSNIDEPEFLAQLNYVPKRTRFTADPNLIGLMVEPLYGNHPGVGVRELVQNSVDAVRELNAWCLKRNIRTHALDLPKQESDVLVEFIEERDGVWKLRICDKGIGMTAETLEGYFMRAGASLRQSPQWAKEYTDTNGKPNVVRSGRFGVGAFAVFLLGDSFRLQTRFAGELSGHSMTARKGQYDVCIERSTGQPIGTAIEIDLAPSVVSEFGLGDDENLLWLTDWYCWSQPTVQRIVRPRVGPCIEVPPNYAASLVGPEWQRISAKGFSDVLWTYSNHPLLACNGIRIGQPDDEDCWPIHSESLNQLYAPSIAVLDGEANLPLELTRYWTTNRLPFEREIIVDVWCSVIAHALVCGPRRFSDLNTTVSPKHPLVIGPANDDTKRRFPDFISRYTESRHGEMLSDGMLRWIWTDTEWVPCDPTMFTWLGKTILVIGGCLCTQKTVERQPLDPEFESLGGTHAVLFWDAETTKARNNGTQKSQELFDSQKAADFFSVLLGDQMICALGTQTTAAEILYRNGIDGAELHPNVTPPRGGKHRTIDENVFQLRKGRLRTTCDLRKLLDRQHLRCHGLVFVGELKVHQTTIQSDSLFAKLWTLFLGARPIPFQPRARQEMIELARQHAALSKHIDAWLEIAAAG